jgi:hypothetical protein
MICTISLTNSNFTVENAALVQENLGAAALSVFFAKFELIVV